MKIHKAGNTLQATRKSNLWACGTCCCFFMAGILLFPVWKSFACLTFLAIVISPMVLQQLSAKIILDDDRIRVKSIFNRKVIEKDTIDSVTWEKGYGVYIKLKNSKRVRIPDLGNTQSVCNSVRAWLKKA